jgi:hypothetical protein
MMEKGMGGKARPFQPSTLTKNLPVFPVLPDIPVLLSVSLER